MRQLEDSFGLAEDACAIGNRLIASDSRFAHLAQMRYVCVLSQPLVSLHGSPCNALIGKPSAQGAFKRMFDWMLAELCQPVLGWEEPEFLILIDAAIWSSLDPIRRERLIFHELKHVVARENEFGVPRLDAEGRPMLRLIAHDIEAFEDEITTYGIDVCGLESACVAIAEGARVDRARARKTA